MRVSAGTPTFSLKTFDISTFLLKCTYIDSFLVLKDAVVMCMCKKGSTVSFRGTPGYKREANITFSSCLPGEQRFAEHLCIYHCFLAPQEPCKQYSISV